MSRIETLAEGVTLYLGDCREILPRLTKCGEFPKEILCVFPACKCERKLIDAVVTDPPYSSGARTDSERQVRGAMLRSMEDADWFSHDAMTTWGFNWFIRSVFTDLRQSLAIGAHVYCFGDIILDKPSPIGRV